MLDTKVTINVSAAGRKGGKARAQRLTANQRSAVARAGAKARWKKFYAENPRKKKVRKKKVA